MIISGRTSAIRLLRILELPTCSLSSSDPKELTINAFRCLPKYGNHYKARHLGISQIWEYSSKPRVSLEGSPRILPSYFAVHFTPCLFPSRNGVGISG